MIFAFSLDSPFGKRVAGPQCKAYRAGDGKHVQFRGNFFFFKGTVVFPSCSFNLKFLFFFGRHGRESRIFNVTSGDTLFATLSSSCRQCKSPRLWWLVMTKRSCQNDTKPLLVINGRIVSTWSAFQSFHLTMRLTECCLRIGSMFINLTTSIGERMNPVSIESLQCSTDWYKRNNRSTEYLTRVIIRGISVDCTYHIASNRRSAS